MTDANVERKRAWSETVLKEFDERGLLGQNHTLVVHAGRDYFEELLPLLEDHVDEINIPTRGLRYGETLSWYNDQLDTNREG